MSKQGQLVAGKNWCFTLNNYTDRDKLKLEGLYSTQIVDYICYGEEIASTGTKHLQGYLQLAKKARLTGLQKIHGRACWIKAKGNAEQNKKYCSKCEDKNNKDYNSEGKFIEIGIIQINGQQKLDFKQAALDVTNGVSTVDLLDKYGNGFGMNRKRVLELSDAMELENKRQKVVDQFDDWIPRLV